MINEIKRHIIETSEFISLINLISGGSDYLSHPIDKQGALTGLSGSFSSALISALYENIRRPMLIIAPDENSASALYYDLKTFLLPNEIFHLCARGIYPFQMKATYFETTGCRLEALYHLNRNHSVVVASATSIAERTIPPNRLANSILEITEGDELEMDKLSKFLHNSGYKRVTMVEEVGDFAVRGGIMDLFPPTTEHPIRIEFFGDEIESIREFSVATQGSLVNRKKITVLPRREFQISEDKLVKQLEKLPSDQIDALHKESLVNDPMPGLEWIIPSTGATTSSVLDYISKDAIVILFEPETIKDKIEEFLSRSSEYKGNAADLGLPTCDLSNLIDDYGVIKNKISDNINLQIYPLKMSGVNHIDFNSYSPTISALRIDFMKNQIDDLLNNGYSVYIACDNDMQTMRVENFFDSDRSRLKFFTARLEQGFVYPHGELAVLTDHELFGHHIRRRPKRYKEGVSLPDYNSLNPGDYVVHIDFGIGRYKGLTSLTVDGRRRDCLHIEYRDDDKIYVPIEQFNRIQKYSGSDSKPKLSKLGTKTWEKSVRRAKKAILEMAQELISIYARRKISIGYSHQPDSDWQKQLEMSFAFEETPDQIRALEEIKSDMQSDFPMDRLICGDVGYGKTELAVRAAFKSVDSGKQVAIIAPTTILAQQHYDTFKKRMAAFPIRIEMLSRFVSKSKQKETIKAIKEGIVDIVIGTHRLLGKDVEFKDIGLLIIDEEQRFGVAHKEKLKRWRTIVDVLTLTATPIPRTMRLALSGAKDMSIINTPPKDRRPIITEVSPFREKVIIEAVIREIDRNGQVYFVHNRVQSIEAMYRYLKKILPSVSFAVAHGQMRERELERIMHRFSRGDFQCLISTTIIESGLDISAVNTIIINRADKLGLAQLYQLRGRVGRSDRQAYAYFLIPPYHLLSETAKRRLKAMEEFTALGSGFHLAMRDLEIRGAGNLLGIQQHGFIEEVGFDLYCRLLDEAIAELKGEEPKGGIETKITIDCDLYIPETYIYENDLRVELYRRLSAVRDYEKIDEISSETLDRFGSFPESVKNLFNMIKIKITSENSGVSRLTLNGEKLIVEFAESSMPTREMVEGFVQSIKSRIEFFHSKRFQMIILLGGERQRRGLEAVLDIMKKVEKEANPHILEMVNR